MVEEEEVLPPRFPKFRRAKCAHVIEVKKVVSNLLRKLFQVRKTFKLPQFLMKQVPLEFLVEGLLP